MARPSSTGGKTSEAEARSPSVTKGRKTTKAKHHIAPAATRVKRRSVSGSSKDLKEAREQQAATAEILKVIARSPSDVQPVFDAIAASANRLINGFSTAVYRFVGDMVHMVAFTPTTPEADAAIQRIFPLPRSEIPAVAMIENGQPAQITDSEVADPQSKRIARARGWRSVMFTPLMSKDVPIGFIAVTRCETGSFADHHIQLLRTFADQAVIAIQNVRLFNETREALERQTAAADILKVIASSPDNVQPVFESIASSANRLIGGFSTAVYRFINGIAHLAAFTPTSPAADEVLKSLYPRPTSDFPQFELARTSGKTWQIPDVEETPEPEIRKVARARGWRSSLGASLVSDGTTIGLITVTRSQIGSFPDQHVQLLQTFADQAVIAIGNVRLFDEVQAKTRDLSEALQHQTATSDVLKVISRSAFDLQKVLDTLAESACRLCDAQDGVIVLREGEFLRMAAHYGEIPVVDKWPVSRAWIGGRAVVDRMSIHVHDLLAEEAEFPMAHAFAQQTGHRTLFAVPMMREQDVIGAITIRRTEVRPFTDKQIELVSTFADQAVIAIENARLFDEVQAKTRDLSEALTYQTGSANILSVIASSPTDVQPVLNAIVGSACHLCDAYDAVVVLKDGEELFVGSHYGRVPLNRNRWPNDRGTISGRAIADRTSVHVLDVTTAAAEFPTAAEMSVRDGGRTVLGIPLIREGISIGAIVLRRTDVDPFKAKEISLLQTFADQAVIAISNVNLFDQVQAKTRDLEESLQQQTATSEVLQVISSSQGELEPVFNKMLENATRICGAEFGTMTLCQEGGFRTVALYNAPKAYAETQLYKVIRPHPKSGLNLVQTTRQPVFIADLRNEPPYVEGNPHVRALADLGGARTIAIVPMLRDDELVGTITIYRQEVKPFTKKQIELVSNFANQAVIAIENARLLNELRDRTEELSRSLNDLRTAQDRLIQTEKLASLGQLTAGIAHEIKNPLNFVNNFSQLSAELVDEMTEIFDNPALDESSRRRELDDIRALLKGNLEKVVQHGKRADSIVTNMLQHSREGSGEHRLTDINAIVDESLNLAYHGARAEKAGFRVAFQRDLDPSAGMADIYPQEITRVLLNLISNAFYATTKRRSDVGDGFEPMLSAGTRNLGEKVEIRIRDNGTGIPDDVKEKIFNPFFTTKPSGEGTGLGLSMSHDIIVKQHGGSIDVATEPGVFTEFKIVLPRATQM
jgi:GAF domain-containing protein